jgi:hypothetical protein
MMKPAEETGWQVLVPFDAQEGMALKKAAGLAGKKETTIRNWCVEHGIGRRVGGGVWVVSKVCGRRDLPMRPHNIAGAYLLRYAQESSWREDPGL